MTQILKFIANIINNIHDGIINIIQINGHDIDDKKLHFVVMAIIGIVIFSVTQYIFRRLAKYSITAISFIYTFTVMVVIVFAIEIQQKLTNRGNMEFDDIAYGLYGFLYFFLIYIITKGIILLVKKLIHKYKKGKSNKYVKGADL